MADGGNAVDAIVATAVTLTLVEPVSNGIGSDAFAIVWDGRQLHGLNASGRSPAAWTPEYFSGDAVPPCGLELRHGAWRGVGVGGAARQVWPVAIHQAVRAGDSLRPQRFSGVADDRRAVGQAGAAVRRRSRVSPTRSCATGGRRCPANSSRSPSTPRRWKRSPRPTARRSTAENSRRQWRRTLKPTAARCSPATLPIIAPTGSTRSPATIAATPCTSSRPMARASSRSSRSAFSRTSTWRRFRSIRLTACTCRSRR